MNILHKSIFLLAIGIMTLLGGACSPKTEGNFTEAELSLIGAADGIMRVLTIADNADNEILRSQCDNFSREALLSDEYARLEELMIATVTHPSQDGVGIAGPQVGLKRRVVAVQRFDKEGEPFEVYPNIRITWASDSLEAGPEGCLSVPDRRGDVKRSQEIVIEYADMAALKAGKTSDGIPMRKETIKDFTAVIFQHEADHLDGILYIDRL
jgi:peptide deformylase